MTVSYPRTVLLAGLILSSAACNTKPPADSEALPPYAVSFAEGRGQLQVGGPFVGIEFHHSRPFPSRISFYAPVANSIDLSTDYWQRDLSQPFEVLLDFDGRTDTLQTASFAYQATPAQVLFSRPAPIKPATSNSDPPQSATTQEASSSSGTVRSDAAHNVLSRPDGNYSTEVSYRFGEQYPIMVLRIVVTNEDTESRQARLSIRMAASLKTSHAYTSKDEAFTEYDPGGQLFTADFADAATDSARVFVSNVGDSPTRAGRDGSTTRALRQDPTAEFAYSKMLAPGEALVVEQLIGSCKQQNCDAILSAMQQGWRADVKAFEDRVDEYALDDGRFSIADTTLSHTLQWSKALLQADRHYIDGHVVPMPTPAQYNFFFTHDLLLTDLGAVMFDTDRVRDDLNYVHLLARGDSLLPHAYYWREDGFKTEPANPDNWNHLWLVIVSASYLRHSGDAATVRTLMPMIRESLRIMLKNERDGLMYANRPDWWDIGNQYGARAYITTLTVRALQSFLYLNTELELYDPSAAGYAALEGRMSDRLTSLWDDEAGYLLNMLDATTVDRHYYTGSLLAAAFDLLDEEHKQTLLATARRELLDPEIGIRNAMPNDFHLLTDVYRFNGPEVGAPFKYMNGGVWPQGIAWYVLGLIAADQPEDAAEATRAYLTLDGIRDSPNGQPAFFEYREADPNASTYGQIDKTAFLWAGGWFIHVLYQLAGVRENAWNLSFDPNTPVGFENAEYDLMVEGSRSVVQWSGSGTTFKRITIDGRESVSAVLSSSSSEILLERGLPERPYLAAATARIVGAEYDEQKRTLTIKTRNTVGGEATYSIVSPGSLKSALLNGVDITDDVQQSKTAEGAYHFAVETTHSTNSSTLVFTLQ